jgi:hypothetical protein
MSRYDRKCPACDTNVSPNRVPLREGDGFPCPACGRKLKSTVPIPGTAVLPVIIAILLAWTVFGLRASIAIALLLVTLPAFFILNALLALKFPPPFRVASNHRDRRTKDTRP